MLNQQKGNMYGFVTHTWNAIKGICLHDCTYCYMKKFGDTRKPVRLDMSELKTDLGHDKTIFVGSSCDMFSTDIPENWINDVLTYCKKFNNSYFFQSKNPDRFIDFISDFPEKTVLCTTIETNRIYPEMGKTVSPQLRAEAMARIIEFEKHVTIEPIMAFDLSEMVGLIKLCNPKQVNIGANTNFGIKLVQPLNYHIQKLVEELRLFTHVHFKENFKLIAGQK